MGIGAHPDDLEIMAYEGILQCFGSRESWYCGVIVTDGGGSARDSLYAEYTNEEMMDVRRIEQKRAAFVGEFGALALLNYPSSMVKNRESREPIDDLKDLLTAARPEVVYTHNLADKHATHIGVAGKTIAAIRELPADARPKRVIGCEVWRGLDWMVDSDKVVMPVDGHENLGAALIGVFDSQIVGGKRYDLATLGRRRANATYLESHAVDTASNVIFGMDLTPLVEDPAIDPKAFALEHIQRFAEDVQKRIREIMG